MWDENIADRWLEVLRKEESLVSRLIEILQSDQRAVAQSRAETIEENVRLKEALLSDLQVVEESKKRLAAAAGIPLETGGPAFAAILHRIPPSRRVPVKDAVQRVRSLRAALAELNEATRQLMLHGLWLVRSALGVIYGSPKGAGYEENGDVKPAAAAGRIVRKHA
jgi:flagellar biosynthesis/type III secretory pathway chaperone